MTRPRTGKLIVLSGPSGSGKSTVVRRVLGAGGLPLRLSVSATTRQPRPGETNGKEYWFLSEAEFDQAIAAERFLEWAQVFGHRYGTLKSEVDPYLEKGTSVLLEIDVQGALKVKQLRPEAVLVFLRTSSLAEYERRLRARGTEDEQSIQRRVAGAARELEQAEQYDHLLINDDLEDAVAQFHRLLVEVIG